jgi:NAD(P)-dependent dehydrogenase (short-subunit alcohol dehydrogenase family)
VATVIKGRIPHQIYWTVVSVPFGIDTFVQWNRLRVSALIRDMAKSILVTGAAGRIGGIGRNVTELLLKHGAAVRAMVRSDDERARALRGMGAEVVVGDLLDLDSMHRAIAGCDTMYFGMSISDAYLTATVNTAAVAKYHGVKAFINMSQMTVSQMSITETTRARSTSCSGFQSRH